MENGWNIAKSTCLCWILVAACQPPPPSNAILCSENLGSGKWSSWLLMNAYHDSLCANPEKCDPKNHLQRFKDLILNRCLKKMWDWHFTPKNILGGLLRGEFHRFRSQKKGTLPPETCTRTSAELVDSGRCTTSHKSNWIISSTINICIATDIHLEHRFGKN